MSKLKVKTGLQNRVNQIFDNYHTTTSDFFQLDVAYFRELVPFQSVNLKLRSQARLAGMPVPSYADINLHRRAFFVPLRVLFKGWNAFIEQQPFYHAGGSTIQSHVPQFALSDIMNLFLDSYISVDAPVSATVYDFLLTYTDEDGVTTIAKARNFTDVGRHIYKVLTQLGYSFQLDNQGRKLSQLDSVKYSALPILALAKIYTDWYIPTQYRDFTSQFVSLQATLQQIYDSVDYDLTSTQLGYLLKYINYVPYGHDYFTDAFDNPVGNNVLNPSISVVDVSSPNYSVSTNNLGTPAIRRPDNNYLSTITNNAIDWLQKLTSWMKRRQLAGSRVLENYLAEYGVKLPAANLNMSVYIDGDQVPVIIRDVTATSQTLNTAGDEGSNLGDYAGQGRVLADSALNISIDTNGEFGIFLVLTSLVPKIGYVQGLRRHCLHIKPLDFYHGDFDALGNREIRLDELAVRPLDDFPISSNYQYPYENVFGFTRQYSEYKCSHDTLSGDFRIGRLNRAGFTSSAWHLNRMFLPDVNGVFSIPQHNLAFVLPNVDKDQYTRIFYVQESDEKVVNADHFVINHIQHAESSAPMSPMYADYDLQHIDGNKEVTLEPNGNYLN